MIRKQVGIILFRGVEVLDFYSPFEIFSVTRLDGERRWDEPSPFNVFLAAQTKDPIVTTGGMKVLPDYDVNECPSLDILGVPGGWGRMGTQSPKYRV